MHDEITTELYLGSKKGAVGTMREGAGNDTDQASLLIALLRVAGFDARYELGTLALSQTQAEQLTGAVGLVPSASLLASAGIPNDYFSFGPGLGTVIRAEHVWVRARVPVSAYRGVARPGSAHGWVMLAPAIKQVATQKPVDLRDAVAFDFDAYLGAPTVAKPSEAYFAELRAFIKAANIRCETLESAQPLRRVIAGDHPILPSDLPVPILGRLAQFSELPPERRHHVTITAETSQGSQQLRHDVPMPALWGKSVTVTDPSGEMAMASGDHPQCRQFIEVQSDQWPIVSRAIDYVAFVISFPRCKRAFEAGCGKKYFPGLERLIYENSLVYVLDTSNRRHTGSSYPGTVPAIVAVSRYRIWAGGFFGVASTIIHEMGHYAAIDDDSEPVSTWSLSKTCVPFFRE